MTEPTSPVARHRLLPWALLAIAGGCLAVTAGAIFMVTQPGPPAAAKNDAIAACHDALADGGSSMTEEDIVGERVFSSMDWISYERAIEAYGYGAHTSVDELPSDQIAETDALLTERRGAGEETVWILWEVEGNDLWQCVVRLLNGEVLGHPVLSSPPME